MSLFSLALPLFTVLELSELTCLSLSHRALCMIQPHTQAHMSFPQSCSHPGTLCLISSSVVWKCACVFVNVYLSVWDKLVQASLRSVKIAIGSGVRWLSTDTVTHTQSGPLVGQLCVSTLWVSHSDWQRGGKFVSLYLAIRKIGCKTNRGTHRQKSSRETNGQTDKNQA